MKKAIFLVLFIFLLSLVPVACGKDPKPAVTVTGFEVYPEVLMKGDTGTISITIKNTAKSTIQETTAYNSTTYMMNADIKSVKLSSREIEVLSDEYLNVGELGAGESLSFTFQVEADVLDGTYFPKVMVGLRDRNMKDISYRIPVKVDSSEITVAVSDIPKLFPKNERSKIKISVANTRPNSVSGVTVIPKGDDISVTPSKFFIGTIESNELEIASFNVTPQTLSEKEMEFEVVYKNGDNWHSETLSVPVSVTEEKKAEILLTGVTIEPSTGINTHVISGELDNVGSDSAKSVLIITENKSGVEPIQPYKSYFVGTLDVDDFGSFELHVRLNGNVTEVPVIIQFRDVDDNLITQNEKISIEFHQIENEKMPVKWMYVFIAIMATVVIIAIAYSWKGAKESEGGGKEAETK